MQTHMLRSIACTVARRALSVPVAGRCVRAVSHATRNDSAPIFLVTTRDRFTSHVVVEEIGVISAGDVRSVNIFKDIAAAVLHMVGGETSYYSHLLNAASEAAADKMVTHAKSLGANAIVGMRLETTTTMNRLVVGMHATCLAYGTAVKVVPRPGHHAAAARAALALAHPAAHDHRDDQD